MIDVLARVREHVREHFLITRYLRDYLAIFNALDGRIPADALPVMAGSHNGRRS